MAIKITIESDSPIPRQIICGAAEAAANCIRAYLLGVRLKDGSFPVFSEHENKQSSTRFHSHTVQYSSLSKKRLTEVTKKMTLKTI